MLDSLIPLTLFPEGGLASSVIVPVWIGVLVVAFFNLRFGWVLSGLVVPGYIVPMLLVNPAIAIANFVETLITFSLSLLISNRITLWCNWSHLFGRDRFFLIVIVSIFVRLIMDTWLFDAFAAQFSHFTGQEIELRSNLHSFGLIIISLMANQMWKTGLMRGSLHLVVTIGITYLIVRYGLMTVTNFSIANLAFMYEEVSVAILASPKSYIILLVSCYIASRMNLRYGWEYAGILVPSLLAIQWYQPLKIAATMVETLLIFTLASLALKNRVLANADITGARKLILFFTISFIYKFLLAWSLGAIAPYQKASDYYAFGYLLSTLIAIKMHDKGLLIPMSRTVLQTSLTALLIATVLGFALSKFVGQMRFFPTITTTTSTLTTPTQIEPERNSTLQAWLIRQRAQAYNWNSTSSGTDLAPQAIDQFREAITSLTQYRIKRNTDELTLAQKKLSKLGASLQLLEEQYLVISHPDDATFGNYIINLNPESSPLLIQAPNAMQERRSYSAALALFKLSNAAFLAISNGFNVFGGTDLNNSNTLFNHFQMVTSKHNVVQIRTTGLVAEKRAKAWSKGYTLEPGENFIWLKKRIPEGLNLGQLEQTISKLSLNWFSPNFTNRQREISQTAFAELLLDRSAATKLITLAKLNTPNSISEKDTHSITGYLQQWLQEQKLQIASKGSQAYQAPELGDALLLLEEVILETLDLIEKEYQNKQWSQYAQSKLVQINNLLSHFNYQLIQYDDLKGDSQYLIIAERFNQGRPRYWGTYVFRLNTNSQHIIEVPRPRFELRTFEVGLHTFETLNARALLIAGAHPKANKDFSSDVLKLRNRRSLFSAFHYGIARYFGDYPMQFTQIRSMSEQMQAANQGADALIDIADNSSTPVFNSPLLSELIDYFEHSGMGVTLNTGAQSQNSPVSANALGLNSQTAQLRYQTNKQVAVVWVSPGARNSFRQAEHLKRTQQHLSLLSIETVLLDVAHYIDDLNLSNHSLSQEDTEPFNHYIHSPDLVALHNAQHQSKLQLRALQDISTQQLFLELVVAGNTIAVLNLNPTQQSAKFAHELVDRGRKFVDGRFQWLFMEQPNQ